MKSATQTSGRAKATQSHTAVPSVKPLETANDLRRPNAYLFNWSQMLAKHAKTR